MRALAAAVILSLAIACTRHGPAPLEMLNTPVTDEQKAVAERATAQVRESFNFSCERVYEEAAPRFQGAARDWKSVCADISAKFGAWRAFVPSYYIRCGAPEMVVCLGGVATFERGQTTVEIGVIESVSEARLGSITFPAAGRRVPRIIPRHVDPSMPGTRQDKSG